MNWGKIYGEKRRGEKCLMGKIVSGEKCRGENCPGINVVGKIVFWGKMSWGKLSFGEKCYRAVFMTFACRFSLVLESVCFNHSLLSNNDLDVS